jgi:hypothetical protein
VRAVTTIPTIPTGSACRCWGCIRAIVSASTTATSPAKATITTVTSICDQPHLTGRIHKGKNGHRQRESGRCCNNVIDVWNGADGHREWLGICSCLRITPTGPARSCSAWKAPILTLGPREPVLAILTRGVKLCNCVLASPRWPALDEGLNEAH